MVTGWERNGGAARFGELLESFAVTSSAPLEPVLARLRRPVGVAVRGRRGVGRGTVAAALASRGVCVASLRPDVRVLVVAETLKPEDERLLADESLPTVIVLTKADVIGSGAKGPLSAAGRRASEIASTTGVRVSVMIGPLATLTTLDADLIAALRVMAAEPVDLSSVDAFVTTPHPVSVDVRRRLLDAMDRFGVAHAVLALAEGVEPDVLVERLHGLSNVDAVLGDLADVAASVRYRRMSSAVRELRCLAIELGDDRLADLLVSDDVVDAVMVGAVEVLEADGLTVDPAVDARGHERRALHWTRYGRGPVDDVHRTCAADIVRGSLRRAGLRP